MLNGCIYTAEEMKDAGLVHILAEPAKVSPKRATSSSAASGGTTAAVLSQDRT